jgi:hypothetical protein
MITTTRRSRAGATRPSPPAHDPRRFASRVKRLSLVIAAAGFGLTWGLVAGNVVGATNAAPSAVAAPTPGTPGRAAVPSTDFFGRAASQPQPILGTGGSGSSGGPVVRGRTS